MSRITDKIAEIEEYASELEGFMPNDLDKYLNDIKTKAACERYFEKITEAIVDLAFLILKDLGLKIPEDDKTAFDMLAKEKLVHHDIAEKLKNAKGMRNILAHQYGNVDDEIVFNSITKEIIKDTRMFLKGIKKVYRK